MGPVFVDFDRTGWRWGSVQTPRGFDVQQRSHISRLWSTFLGNKNLHEGRGFEEVEEVEEA